jgi:LacI family transcriptional regulator
MKSKKRNALPISSKKRVIVAMDWVDFEIHRGIALFAREAGWILNLHMMHSRTFPVGWQADGVVAGLGAGSPNYPLVKGLGVPVVDIDVHHGEDFPQVVADHFASGCLAGEYLLKQRHREFAFFFLTGSQVERELFRGLSTTVEKRGFVCREIHLHAGKGERPLDYSQADQWLRSKLTLLPNPVAVMTQDDEAASLVLGACLNAGIHVPEEVAVMGAGNVALICDFAPITLSSVDNNAEMLGYTAASCLHDLMEGKKLPPRTIVPSRGVVERESTNFLAVSDPTVRKALRFIWDNHHREIDVEDVTVQVPLSRAGLYRRFGEHVGHPIATEITRLRIRHAKQLLSQTQHQIGKIARLVGYANLVSFSRAFQQNEGCSPKEYRAKEKLAVLRPVTAMSSETGATAPVLTDRVPPCPAPIPSTTSKAP